MGFISAESSGPPFGRALAERVAACLEQGHSIAYGHRDYCGLGLQLDGNSFVYGEVWDGRLPVEGDRGVLLFACRTTFIEWLACQSDASLARKELADVFYHDNQTITHARLEEFVTFHERHPQVTLPRWKCLWKSLGARSDGEEWFGGLVAAWSEPQRYYHNLDHLNDCLELLNRYQNLAATPWLIEAALWFHDAVYDPQSGVNNEEASALYARDALEAGGVPEPVILRVSELIHLTRTHEAGSDVDAALLCDIDLSILGRPPAVFNAYDRAIRQEYAWVPDREYQQGRSRVLRQFLAREQIFQLPVFNDLFEAQARRNLSAALLLLGTD